MLQKQGVLSGEGVACERCVGKYGILTGCCVHSFLGFANSSHRDYVSHANLSKNVISCVLYVWCHL